MISLLLDKGGDIESAKRLNCERPLHVAVSYDRPDIVALLVERGAIVEPRNASDRTALHMAADKGYAGAAKVLLENKADVNAKFMSQKFSALHAASYSDHKELSNGADTRVKSKSGLTPMMVAKSNFDKGVVEVFVRHGVTQ